MSEPATQSIDWETIKKLPNDEPLRLSDSQTDISQSDIDHLVVLAGGDISLLDFSNCVFVGDIDLSETHAFKYKRVLFSNCDFKGENTLFELCDYSRAHVSFRKTKFATRSTSFRGSKLGVGNTDFRMATFGREATDLRADFGRGYLDFSGTKFGSGDVDFGTQTFDVDKDYLDLSSCIFKGVKFSISGTICGVEFDNSDFGDGILDIDHCKFQGHVGLRNANLSKATVIANNSEWAQPVAAHGEIVSFDNAVLAHGGDIEFQTELSLSGTVLEGPLHVTTTHAGCVSTLDNAKLRSMLTINSGVRLDECTFNGTQGVENLRLSGRPFRDGGLSGRQYLIHDIERSTEDRALSELDKAFSRTPNIEVADEDLADIYRRIRTGLESAGNIPSAHDFYYGEMEARRRARRVRPKNLLTKSGWASLLDYLLLSGYRAFSDYGLSVARPASYFLFTIVIGVAALLVGGFKPGAAELSIAETLEYVTRTATLFFRPSGDPTELTLPERWIQLALRFVGPFFLGLFFLGVRNRVRR